MARVGSKNTLPEMNVRSALFRAGFRFRTHKKGLPGRPDLVLPKYRLAVFVHGCFWHSHNCRRGKKPSSNEEFWEKKLAGNVLRDKRNMAVLRKQGWTVRVIWTCNITVATKRLVRELERRRSLFLIKARQN